MSKQLRGFAAYEKDICSLLNFESFETMSSEDIEGAYGVAMIMAHVWDGVDPVLFELANWLNISSTLLAPAYDRLRINGVFNSDYNARKDSLLLMGVKKSKVESDLNLSLGWSIERSQRAYGIIHGISAGLVGVR